jgi:hypothetical protein
MHSSAKCRRFSRAEGVLLQRTIGDNGSSVYAAGERADRP